MKSIQPVNAVRRKVVVMRLPNLAAPATEVEAPAPETVSQAAHPPGNNSAGKVTPKVLQSVIAGGAIVVIIAAGFILNSRTSSTGTDSPAGDSAHLHDHSLANADKPSFEPPRRLLPADVEPEPDESDLVLNASQSSSINEPTRAEPDFDTSDANLLPDPIDNNSMQLNGPAAPTPSNSAVSDASAVGGGYPTTDPERWRYPEFEIRSPLEEPAAAPRFADRMGGSPPRANERDATTWERR